MRRLKIAVIMVVAAFAFTGCAVSLEKIADKAAEPILGLAVGDAQTSLALIEQLVSDGRLAPALADEARRCPNAVIALDHLRREVAAEKEPEGRKLLIYAAIKRKYGRDVAQTGKQAVADLFAGCGPLLPIEKLLGL